MMPDKIRREFTNPVLYAKRALDAWKNVEIVRKKDGGYFKDYTKSFRNLYIYKNDVYDRIELKVKFEMPTGNEYVDEDGKTCWGLNYEEDIISFKVKPSTEEVMLAIEKRKVKLENDFDDAMIKYDIADSAYDKYMLALEKAEQTLLDACDRDKKLYKEIKYLIKNS